MMRAYTDLGVLRFPWVAGLEPTQPEEYGEHPIFRNPAYSSISIGGAESC
jgi:hypothetical protein